MLSPWPIGLHGAKSKATRGAASALVVSCAVPSVVHLQETPTEIVIAVTGAPSLASFDSPCTAQKVSLVGYVQLSGPVGDRRIVEDTA